VTALDVRRGIRPLDVALTALLLALGTWLMVLNIFGGDATTPVDSHSWLVLPVFLLAMVPVLWWRRHLVAVAAVAAAAMTAHVLLFGHMVRCGAGLPLVFVLAFLSGFARGRRGVVALVPTGVASAAVLAYDTAAGPELLPVALIIVAVLFGVGRVTRSRALLAEELRGRTEDLRSLRDERAALEVRSDRLHVSQQLEELLDARLARLEAAADEGAGTHDPQRARAALLAIEEDSRQALDDMRQAVGVLRGGEARLAPTPSVAQLDALLARLGGGRLSVDGDPRVLPASLELSAYRIVEHLVGVLADGRDAPVGVRVRFGERSLELSISGPVHRDRGADLRQAVARARERALVHAGSLDLRVSRGQAQVLARLPVPEG
jgi:signal transduction histidine kinase